MSPMATTVLNHIRKTGSITGREAILEYSCQSLTKEINRIRSAGHEVRTIIKHHPITGQRYARYSLAEGST